MPARAVHLARVDSVDRTIWARIGLVEVDWCVLRQPLLLQEWEVQLC